MRKCNPESICGNFKPGFQRGMATLAMAVILLLISTILVFAVAKATMYDQKFYGNDLRTQELYETAKGGLEFGLSWLARPKDSSGNSLDIAWNDASGNAYAVDESDENILVGATATPIFPANPANPVYTVHHTGNVYNLAITYELLSSSLADNPAVVRVTATANPSAGEQHLRKTVSVLAMRADRIDGDGLGSGPIIVEGCVDGTQITGTGQVIPGDSGVGLASMSGNDSCVSTGALNMSGGDAMTTTSASSLSESIFGISDPDVLDQMMYDLSLEPGSKILYYDSTNPYNLGDLPAGFNVDIHDPTDPAWQRILYFPQSAGCPKINGSPTIVGLVYYNYDNCQDHGWGGATIYGTVAVSGDLEKMSANGQIIGNDLSGIVAEVNELFSTVAMVPGTWKDF